MVQGLRKFRNRSTGRTEPLYAKRTKVQVDDNPRETSAKEVLMFMDDLTQKSEGPDVGEGLGGWQDDLGSAMLPHEREKSRKLQVRYRIRLEPLEPAKVNRAQDKQDTIQRLKRMLVDLRESQKDLDFYNPATSKSKILVPNRQDIGGQNTTRTRLKPLKSKMRLQVNKENESSEAQIIQQLMYGVGSKRLQKSHSQSANRSLRRRDRFTLDKLLQ